MAARGTGGCSIEQPLEATLKALTRSDSASSSSKPAGGRPRRGQQRLSGQVVACHRDGDRRTTARRTRLYDIDDPSLGGTPVNALLAWGSARALAITRLSPSSNGPPRESEHPASVSRYVDSFSDLRPVKDFVIFTDTGIPVDLAAKATRRFSQAHNERNARSGSGTWG